MVRSSYGNLSIRHLSSVSCLFAFFCPVPPLTTLSLTVPYSPGGICFERYGFVPDLFVDYWDVTEKAKYPYYFAKREAAKEEYIKLFEKRWGVHPAVDYGITHHLDVEDPETEEEKKYGKNGQFGKPILPSLAKTEKH